MTARSASIPAADLARCYEMLPEQVWRQLAGRRIFMTGGTGFVGKWLTATLLDVDRRLGLNCEVTVLTRDPAAFQSAAPELASQMRLVQGDVRDFVLPTDEFDTIIHAATDVAALSSPQATFDTCVEGTRRVLALARACGAKDLLMVSSGAVYGRAPPQVTHIPECYTGAPDSTSLSSAYGAGKRAAEWLACASGADGSVAVKIARCFAFVGPHLPLDKHFAIGNFIKASLESQPIVIVGDGTPVRSYLYAADMAAWLWAVLLNGQPGSAYNVGAEESLTIAELARRVVLTLGTELPISILQPAPAGHQAQHYVPDTKKARAELGLPAPLPLDQAILRTAQWHRQLGQADGPDADRRPTLSH